MDDQILHKLDIGGDLHSPNQLSTLWIKSHRYWMRVAIHICY